MGEAEGRNGRSPISQEFFDGKADILSDLTQQNRRNISSRMEGNRSATIVGMAILFMEAPLPNL